MININQAIERGHLRWGDDISNVDVETAYQDRTALADEVKRVRQELADTEEALHEAESEVDRLIDQAQATKYIDI
jgi:hypothetical protein